MNAFQAEIASRDRSRDPADDQHAPPISVPIYTVPADQPTVRVKLRSAPSRPQSLQQAWEAVPLPPGAHPAAGTDRHLVVWQPSTDKLWEFWRLRHDEEGWHVTLGRGDGNVSTNLGRLRSRSLAGRDQHWGASASSLSIAGGLITLEDLPPAKSTMRWRSRIPDVRAKEYSLAGPTHRRTLHRSAARCPRARTCDSTPTSTSTPLHLPPADADDRRGGAALRHLRQMLGGHVVPSSARTPCRPGPGLTWARTDSSKGPNHPSCWRTSPGNTCSC